MQTLSPQELAWRQFREIIGPCKAAEINISPLARYGDAEEPRLITPWQKPRRPRKCTRATRKATVTPRGATKQHHATGSWIKPHKGEMQLKVWMELEAERIGKCKTIIWQRLRDGKFPNVKLRTVSAREVYVILNPAKAERLAT